MDIWVGNVYYENLASNGGIRNPRFSPVIQTPTTGTNTTLSAFEMLTFVSTCLLIFAGIVSIPNTSH